MQFEEEKYFTPRDNRHTPTYFENNERFNNATRKHSGRLDFDHETLVSVARRLNFDLVKYRDVDTTSHSLMR